MKYLFRIYILKSVVGLVLLSWFWDIFVAVVVGVSGSFVLEVLFVIVD